MTAIYLFINDQQAGPYAPDQIRTLMEAGQITKEIPAWCEGATEWVPLGSLITPSVFVTPSAPSLPEPTVPLSQKIPHPIKNPGLIAGIGAIIFWCVLLPLWFSDTTPPAAVTNPPKVSQSSSPPKPDIPDLPRSPTSPSSMYPALDEKDGFREYILGRSLSKFNSADLGQPFIAGDEQRYMLVNFDKKIGICQVANIRLDFNQGYLTDIIICVDGEQNVEALKEAFIAAYGQPKKGTTIYPSYVWDGYNVVLDLQTDKDFLTGATSGKAYFMSRNSVAEVKAIVDRKAQEAATQAAKHL